MTGTSPPGPFRCGSTTCSVKAGADRERGGEGKRVDFGGGRFIKKKKKICIDGHERSESTVVETVELESKARADCVGEYPGVEHGVGITQRAAVAPPFERPGLGHST